MNNNLRIEVGDLSIFVEGDYELTYDSSVIKISSTQSINKDNFSEIKHDPLNYSEIKEPLNPIFDMHKIRIGGQALYALIETWCLNFNTEGEQPDRMKALIDSMLNHGDEIIILLKSSEGLTNALLDLFPCMPDANEIQLIDHAKFYRKIACNLAQVASVSMPELSDYLEPNSNYLEQKFWW